MSAPLFAVQMSPQLLEKPDISDLYTILINDGDKWYTVGLHLGIGTDTLEKIKAENSAKPSLCKRAMFREWLKVCPKGSCTWKHVIDALRDVDQKEAERVMQTISADTNLKPQSPGSLKPHTAQFPLQIESSVVKSHIREKKPRIGTDGCCELLIKKQQALVEGLKTPGEMEGDDDSGTLKKSDISLESCHETEQSVRGSLSVDVYETASEDDDFMGSNSQHDADATVASVSTKSVEKDQVIKSHLHF